MYDLLFFFISYECGEEELFLVLVLFNSFHRIFPPQVRFHKPIPKAEMMCGFTAYHSVVFALHLIQLPSCFDLIQKLPISYIHFLSLDHVIMYSSLQFGDTA